MYIREVILPAHRTASVSVGMPFPSERSLTAVPVNSGRAALERSVSSIRLRAAAGSRLLESCAE